MPPNVVTTRSPHKPNSPTESERVGRQAHPPLVSARVLKLQTNQLQHSQNRVIISDAVVDWPFRNGARDNHLCSRGEPFRDVGIIQKQVLRAIKLPVNASWPCFHALPIRVG